jgi:hypothetical protein
MAAALETAGVRFDKVNVDADPGLRDRYGMAVPVLVKDGVELCRHRLTAEALAKLR